MKMKNTIDQNLWNTLAFIAQIRKNKNLEIICFHATQDNVEQV